MSIKQLTTVSRDVDMYISREYNSLRQWLEISAYFPDDSAVECLPDFSRLLQERQEGRVDGYRSHKKAGPEKSAPPVTTHSPMTRKSGDDLT